jgi:Transglutaminase-like superfamily
VATPRYTLMDHVFVCEHDGHVVILDLRGDRYYTLDPQNAGSLAGAVRGWPVVLATSGSDEDEVARALLEKGILSERSDAGKDATPVIVHAPSHEILPQEFGERPPLRWGTIAQFLRSTAAAAIAIRRWPLERVIDRVKARNQAHRAEVIEAVQLQRLITLFATMRPVLFSARDACLFESLALSEFLARHGVYPTWIFGVQARPFAAHCWLQLDGSVLNDTVDHVIGYTPIMAV